MATTDPWADFRVGPSPFSQADPYRIPPDPIAARRQAEEDERKRQAAAIQVQQAQSQLNSQPLVDQGRMLDNQRKQQELTQPDPDDAKGKQKSANLDALVTQINRVQELFDSGQRDNAIPLLGSLWEYLPTQDNTQFDAASAGMAEQGLAAFRVPGVGSQSDAELRQFVEANKPSTWSNDSSNLERLRQLRVRVDATRAALGLPKAEWSGLTDEDAQAQGLERHNPAAGGSQPGGGQTPPSGGGGDFLSQFGAANRNALAGAAQGVAGIYDFPMAVGNAVEQGVTGALGAGGGALLDATGFPGAADWLRQGARGNQQRLANQPTAADAIEQLSPTPQGMGGARFASQLLGGMAVPFGPKGSPSMRAPAAAPARNAAQQVIAEGARNNVRVMTSDVRPPTTFIGKTARSIGERVPYAGTGGPRAAQQGERVEAVRNLAREFGADAGGELLDQVASDLATTRGGRISTLANAKNNIIDGVGGTLSPVNVARTLEAIDAQVNRLAGIDAEAYAPVINRLTAFGANIASGKSLRQVEQNRKLLGEMFEDQSLAAIKGEGQKAINAIYAPLRDDMGEFIRANAGNAAFDKWASANSQLAQMAGELGDNVFRGVLRSAEATPENVARVLFSKKPSDVRRLMANISPEGRAKAQGAVIQRAMEQAGGFENVSPDRFANAVDRLSRSVGVVFQGTDLARVQGLARLLQSTKQAGVAAAAPPTGVQNSVPILSALLVDSMGGAGAATSSAAAAGLTARLYESTAVRNLLAGLGKTKPGSAAEGRMFQRIIKVMTSQSQIQAPAMGRSFNDNLPIAAQSVAQDRDPNKRY